jgi:methionyl-tRNA formyltransferase
MRILYFGNNWVGWQILQWLKAQRQQVVGLVLHPDQRCKFGKEMRGAVDGDNCAILDGSRLQDQQTLDSIRDLRPDIGISALFGYILRRELLALLPNGCINIHPALLPYNRGAFPNVWSIVDKTPAGVTIHYIDEGVDTGDLISQRRVDTTLLDTGESLYRKLEFASLELFQQTWPLLKSGKVECCRQEGKGSRHRVHDVEQIDEIDPGQSYRAGELIDILRARTFPPYPGAYIRCNGRKIYLRVQLLDEDQLSKEFADGIQH